jgi:hypothetical protein
MAQSFSVNNAAAVSKAFVPGTTVSGGTTYVGADSTGAAPQQALVKHTFGLAVGSNDKHLLQFSQSRIDSATAKAGKVTVNVTVTIPPVGATSTDLGDVIAFAKNFLSDAALVSKLENGSI